MPSILQELLAARKATKKQMAKETDPFMKNILDKRQLSIEVQQIVFMDKLAQKLIHFMKWTLLLQQQQLVENY